jgi:hypothetical protein
MPPRPARASAAAAAHGAQGSRASLPNREVLHGLHRRPRPNLNPRDSAPRKLRNKGSGPAQPGHVAFRAAGRRGLAQARASGAGRGPGGPNPIAPIMMGPIRRPGRGGVGPGSGGLAAAACKAAGTAGEDWRAAAT